MIIRIDFSDQRESIEIKADGYNISNGCIGIKNQEKDYEAYIPLDCISCIVVYKRGKGQEVSNG